MSTTQPQQALAIGRALEYLAGASAIFLLASYIAGRVYLQSFYGVFQVDLADLDLSVQDIMFQSWRSFLAPIVSTLILLALLPRVRRLIALDRLVDDTHTRLAQLRARLNVEGESAQLASDLDSIEQDIDFVYRTSGAATLERLMQNHRLLRLAIRLTPPYVAFWLGSVPLFGAISLLAEWWLYGPNSAAIDSGMLMLSLAAVFTAFWTILQSLQGKWSIVENALAIMLLVLFLAVIPLTRGLGRAYSIRLDKQPGRGLPAVTLVADRRVDPTWRLDGLEYVSPPLRWIGRNDTYLVLWDPAAPDETLYINNAAITRIER